MRTKTRIKRSMSKEIIAHRPNRNGLGKLECERSALFFVVLSRIYVRPAYMCVCVIVQSVRAAGGVYNCLIPSIDFACTMEYV